MSAFEQFLADHPEMADKPYGDAMGSTKPDERTGYGRSLDVTTQGFLGVVPSRKRNGRPLFARRRPTIDGAGRPVRTKELGQSAAVRTA
jgi:hypothetical protein